MPTPPLAVRMRQPLRDDVTSCGMPHTAARALIILGLAALGRDVQKHNRDIRRLLAKGNLDPDVHAALNQLLDSSTQNVVRSRQNVLRSLKDDFEVVPVVLPVPEPENDAFDGWDV